MTNKITLNPFDQNQRRLFQFGIIFLLLMFFTILLLVFQRNISNVPSAVILSDSKLQVFNETYDHFSYPDRINVHYPYLLVIQPEKTLTTVYDLEKKEKKQEFKQVLLDYDGRNILYNGKDTFFNNVDLGVLCSGAFIKSEKEILCAMTNSKSKVLSIDPETKIQETIYETNNLLTTVGFVQEKLYVGEMDMKTNKSYLVINGKRIEISTPVNLVYPMRSRIYVASFKSIFTQNKVMYFAVGEDNSIVLVGEKVIISE